jgi:hypothetical protein
LDLLQNWGAKNTIRWGDDASPAIFLLPHKWGRLGGGVIQAFQKKLRILLRQMQKVLQPLRVNLSTLHRRLDGASRLL